jgi:hypothetical protein
MALQELPWREIKMGVAIFVVFCRIFTAEIAEKNESDSLGRAGKARG